jgi:membrane associated rhomboid family serine protease
VSQYRPGGFGGFSFFPPVIKNLLILNGVIFILQKFVLGAISIGGIPGWYVINRWLALNPISGVDPIGMEYNFQVWQLITYQFLHGDFFHILFNMFILWMFGIEIENLWGSKKFLWFYLLCGVVAGLFHILVTPLISDLNAFTVGASGSITGVMVAFAMMFPNRLIFLYFLIPIKAKYFIGFLILLDLLLVNNPDNIARLAHLGGALTGFLFVLLDPTIPSEIKNLFGRGGGHQRAKKPFNPFGGMGEKFKKKEPEPTIEDVKYYEIKEDENSVNQEEIDAILDKISQSGYQNLSEREKKILFEASKKMK